MNSQSQKPLLTHLFCIALFLSFALLGGCKQINHNLTWDEAKRSYHEGDARRAFSLSELLAYEGNSDAEYAVGYMYYYGHGTPQNQPLGIARIRQAAKQGNCMAIQALHDLEHGQVVIPSFETVIKVNH